MKRSTLAYAGLAAFALALPMTVQAEPGHRGHGGPGAILKLMDADGDGQVTRAEAETAIATLFAEIDANSDGYVIQEEMKTHREAKRAEMRERWASRADRPAGAERPERRAGNHEANPERMEARRARMAERSAERWAAMDTDGDGRLSLAEFTAARIQRFDRVDADNDGVVTAEEAEAAREAMKERRGQWRGKKASE